MYVALVLVGLVAAASAKDLTVGQEGGSLKYEQNFTASPTIWRQEKRVTFGVSESEVITQVVVEDHREDKNGEAAIIEGGEGHKNVTIELKSPAVFRGFDFEVQVYAKQDNDTQIPVNNDRPTVQDPLLQDTQVNDKQIPENDTGDVITGTLGSTTTTPVPNSQDKVQSPVVIGQDDNQKARTNRDSQETTPGKDLQSDSQNENSKPMTDDKDVQGVIKGIFDDNKSTKPAVEPTKATQVVDDTSVIGFNGGKQVPSSTSKSVEKPVEIPEADVQQDKKQVNLPLPYVKQ